MTVVRWGSMIAGFGAAVGMVWYGIGALGDADVETWTGVMMFATAPVLVSMGVSAPDFVTARTNDERTLLVSQPLQAGLTGAALFIGCLGMAGALGGGWWYLGGGIVGALMAAGEVDAMKRLHRTLEWKMSGEPIAPDREGDYTTFKAVTIIARSALGMLVSVIFLTTIVYLAFGRGAAVLAACAYLVALVSLYATIVWRVRSAQRRAPKDR